MTKGQGKTALDKWLEAQFEDELEIIIKQSNTKRSKRILELQSKWAALLDMEETAFQRCCELDSSNPQKSPEKSKAVRHWWNITNSILWMFTRTRTQYDHELKPFPAYVFGRLANISEELSCGIIPTFVTDARGGGGRPLYRGERHHIAYAVFYVEAVKRSEIDDKAPNKTVRQAYNVTAKAVQGWLKRRDDICVGVPFEQFSPTELRSKMLESGEIYTRIGRGAPSDN